MTKKAYMTMVSFRFPCPHDHCDPNQMSIQEIREYCIGELNNIKDEELCGAIYIEEDTTEESNA
tara:strand:+ start:677 stop:868 length:192 start_codon:yes stop_codon:yes gene_type:complete